MRPLVTVIIATFNSAKLLPKVLESIKEQRFYRKKLEILLVDGGSTDETLSIGRKYNCHIIRNPRTEPVYGKYLAYLKARGEYIMYLDHDEVLLNRRSIVTKIAALRSSPNVAAVAGGGYRSPKGYPFVNDYINEFGDPFSFFIYSLSKADNFFLETMKKRYKAVLETKDHILFNLSGVSNLPIIELVAGGSMFDAKVLKREFPETKKRFELLPHYFYLLHSKYPYVALIKNDPIMHYSSDTLNKYLKKILWRVKNNIYFSSTMGESGYIGRSRFQSTPFQYKKYLFIPYSFSILFPLIDALYLALTRKNLGYLMHIFLTLFTASVIIYYYVIKFAGIYLDLKNYDESKVIHAKTE